MPSILNGLMKQEKKLPNVCVSALAGSGKSACMVDLALNRIRGNELPFTPSEEQQAIIEAIAPEGYNPSSVLMVAFNKSIQKELDDRTPEDVTCKTMHSLGLSILRESFTLRRYNTISTYKVDNLIGEVLGIDSKKLRITRKVDYKAIKDLVGLVKVCLLPKEDWSPASFRSIIANYMIKVEDEQFVLQTCVAILERTLNFSQDLYVDFDDMIWLPVMLDLHCYKHDLVLVDESQDLSPLQQELCLRASKRLVIVGDKNQCQPVGTKVQVTGKGEVPIEDLKVGQELMTYKTMTTYFAGSKRQGRKILDIKKRNYEGELITITAGNKKSSYTPNHRCLVRFSKKKVFCVYVMRKGDWLRVGVCRFEYKLGVGIAVRSRQEDSDESWILKVCDTEIEARVYEEIISCTYGIPQMVFTCRSESSVSEEVIKRVHDSVSETRDNLILLESLLNDHWRDIKYPIWSKDKNNWMGFTKSSVMQACNLLGKGCMQVKVFSGDVRDATWKPFNLRRTYYKGDVVSLNVEPTEGGKKLYVADGIVTHNSIYGFAGSDVNSIDNFIEQLDGETITLPMNQTRRCGWAIIREAQKIVPSFTGADNVGEGFVGTLGFDDGEYRKKAEPGDMVICRVNAPLASQCLKFIKEGKKATIIGRDFGKQLVNIVNSNYCDDVLEFIGNLDNWKKESLAKKLSDNTKIIIADQHACLVELANELSDMSSLQSHIESMFSDEEDNKAIRLSSIHKSKGLEADRVFFIRTKDTPCPHPMAQQDWAKQQEKNLVYIGITRAIKEFYWVK